MFDEGGKARECMPLPLDSETSKIPGNPPALLPTVAEKLVVNAIFRRF
jgi:hypothetical protein